MHHKYNQNIFYKEIGTEMTNTNKRILNEAKSLEKLIQSWDNTESVLQKILAAVPANQMKRTRDGLTQFGNKFDKIIAGEKDAEQIGKVISEMIMVIGMFDTFAKKVWPTISKMQSIKNLDGKGKKKGQEQNQQLIRNAIVKALGQPSQGIAGLWNSFKKFGNKIAQSNLGKKLNPHGGPIFSIGEEKNWPKELGPQMLADDIIDLIGFSQPKNRLQATPSNATDNTNDLNESKRIGIHNKILMQEAVKDLENLINALTDNIGKIEQGVATAEETAAEQLPSNQTGTAGSSTTTQNDATGGSAKSGDGSAKDKAIAAALTTSGVIPALKTDLANTELSKIAYNSTGINSFIENKSEGVSGQLVPYLTTVIINSLIDSSKLDKEKADKLISLSNDEGQLKATRERTKSIVDKKVQEIIQELIK
jgi:hypothetical protein